MSRLRSLMASDKSVFNAGTDLVMSLFAIMVVVYAFTVGKEINTKGEVTELKGEIASLRQKEDDKRQLEAALDSVRKELFAVSAERVHIKDELSQLRKMVAKLEEEAEEKQKKEATRDGLVAMELLELPEKLDYVAFVVDTSVSMNVGSANKDGKKTWDSVLATIKRWVEYLPVEHARLIVFNSTVVKRLPEDGSFQTMSALAKQQFVDELSRTAVANTTNTLAAVNEALNNESTQAVVLLTDGAPDGNQADQILEKVRKHNENRSIPVVFHTIALGEFYQVRKMPNQTVQPIPPTPMLKFLIQLAQMTGGTFRAQTPAKME